MKGTMILAPVPISKLFSDTSWMFYNSTQLCQPTPVFLPGEPPWTEEPRGL